MRHKLAFKKLGRTMEHRKSLRRNLAQSLFEHGQIRTTVEKAKDLQPFAEHMITLAKRAHHGDLNSRRRLHRLLGERFIIPADNQEEYEDMTNAGRRAVRQYRSGRRHRTGEPRGAVPFTTRAISHVLIQDLAPRFDDRQGGYTRIIHLSSRRIGDAGEQAILQLVGEEQTPSNVPRSGKSSRRRKADMRYAALMKSKKGDTDRPAAAEQVAEAHDAKEVQAVAPQDSAESPDTSIARDQED